MTQGILFGNTRGISEVRVNAVDFAAVNAATSVEQAVTVPGVREGDSVHLCNASLTAGIIYGTCRVSANDTVQVTIANVTAGSLNPASQNLDFIVARQGFQAFRVID